MQYPLNLGGKYKRRKLAEFAASVKSMNYAEIKNVDVANGPGVRVSLFVSGCTHHCPGCFNPETWDFAYGTEFGEAEIEKTPEPMKQLGPKDRQGKFTACYTKKAQPDYKGTLKGGRSVVFEAKHTSGDRLEQSVVTDDQRKRLDRHMALGAECFVMVSFGFREFFKVPWAIFRAMKEHYGRKYIKPEDVQEYKVKYIGGVLRFL